MGLDPLSAALDIGGKLIDRLWPDPTQKAAAALELLKLQQSGELAQITGQMDIDKVEAASQSIFVAGWRPYIGWVCGFGLAYQFVTRPLFQAITDMIGSKVQWQSLDIGTLMTLLFGMLGMGAMRSYDKVSGNANGH